jgi:hypothetical protein
MLKDVQGTWVGFELGNLGCVHSMHGVEGKQKAISFSNPDKVKETDNKTRIYLDLSSIKKPKDIKQIHNQHCHILVNKKTQMKFVESLKRKTGCWNLHLKNSICGNNTDTRLT